MSQTILVVAAHTDDEVLGVGGAMAKHVALGDAVYVCSLCDRATRHKYDQKIIQDLRKMALRASHILGITQTFFCGLLDEQLELVKAVDHIEKYIADLKPDIIYTHHVGDANQDHATAFRATMIAARTTTNLPAVDKILCYEVPSSTEQSPPLAGYAFIPNVFVDISEVLPIKLKALRAYKTELAEFPHPRSISALSALAQMRGSQVGLKAAEAFVLVREVIR